MVLDESSMSEQDRRFYKKKMKKIKEALNRGDKAAANRHAFDILDYFGI